MPTGPKHIRILRVEFDDDGEEIQYIEECRCMIGEDHNSDGDVVGGGEALSVYDAADIWLSNGMDPDYDFGYTESELLRAAGME